MTSQPAGHHGQPAARTYRPVPDNIASGIVLGGTIGLCAYILATQFSWVWIGLIALLAILLVAQLRRRIEVNSEGLTIHTLVSAKAVPWANVTSVGVVFDAGDRSSSAGATGAASYTLLIYSQTGVAARARHSRWARAYVYGVKADLDAWLVTRQT